ncbi:TlpA family protein disulfide reductase [Nocardioides sp.]|uniref:TlpA family protein disulfide reductase n=1 Tax=Nocardioides sp. TaxID=35761 RepID=UPI003563105E
MSRRRPARILGALLAAVVLLGGCADADGGVSAPGAARVDVDTPALRAAKAEAGVEPCTPGTGAPVEDGLPAVTLPCFGGGPDVDLATVRGPLVVSLWASWCQPCRKEMPVLQEFYAEHGDRVGLLGIDYQDVQTQAAMALVSETGATYPLLADPQGDLDRAEPFPSLRGLPFLALVDADGRVVHQEFTIIESQQELVDLVEQHLGVVL